MIAVALQRCACGASHDGGECPACRARRLARASALVGQTLSRPGRPLEPVVRTDLERSLGHDFGAVRVHADDTAAASAAGSATICSGPLAAAPACCRTWVSSCARSRRPSGEEGR